jgi:hypothetical protein
MATHAHENRVTSTYRSGHPLQATTLPDTVTDRFGTRIIGTGKILFAVVSNASCLSCGARDAVMQIHCEGPAIAHDGHV